MKSHIVEILNAIWVNTNTGGNILIPKGTAENMASWIIDEVIENDIELTVPQGTDKEQG
jgi:hypothetical protein